MIILVEPQCVGFEHVPINSAFIKIFLIAFPNENILMLGEKIHIDLIDSNLGYENRVKYKEIIVPKRKERGYFRFFREIKLIKEVFKIATQYNTDKIMFLSITGEGLAGIKLSTIKRKEYSVYIVPHTILEDIIKVKSKKRFWEFPFWFKNIFLLFNCEKIKYIVLGEYIKEYIDNNYLKLREKVVAIQHPYVFKPQYNFIPFKDNIVKIGFIGVGHRNKGADLFFKLAEYICGEKGLNAEFYLIGHIVDKKIEHSINKYVKICSDKPLEQKEYDKYISDMDYTVFLYNPDSYKLIASGAILDAFSHIKPIIVLKNNMFSYYFNKYGEIGYLCEDFDEVKEKVEKILVTKDINEYSLYKKNIEIIREIYNVNKLSEELKLGIQK